MQQSYLGFVDELTRHGFNADQIELFDVPGSLKIPLQAQLLAKTGQYTLIAGAGLIVDGGIYRHDFVAQTVLDGMMRVQLDHSIPVLSVVLTPHHFQETKEHIEFFYQHFSVKGKEAASSAVKMMENILKLA